MADDDKKLSTGRLARLAKLAGMSARLSTDVVARGVKRFTSKEPVEGDELSMLGAGAAEKLVATLGDLKGLAMKIGQQVSMEPDLLSPEVRAVIARLQNQAPPMPWTTVEEVLTRELGRPVRESFARVDEVPLASASLGQVHRGWTHQGDAVAVKVQYPDIARALKSDLDNLGTMVSVMASSTRITQGRSYFAELQSSMLDELDYRAEAARAEQFRQAAAGLPELMVPRVYTELTSEKVLTLELIEGRTLKDLLQHRDEVPNEERFRASRLLIRAIFGPFLLTGTIHADPHPGNFMLLADGRMGVLDFGAIKSMSDTWVRTNRALYRAVVEGTDIDCYQLSRDASFTFDEPEVARPFVDRVVDIATRPARSHDFDFAQAFINRDMRNHFIRHAPHMPGMRPPKESVQFFRAVGGLSQNLENLAARGDFKAVYAELLALIPPG